MDVVIKSLLHSPNPRASASDCPARTRLLRGFSRSEEKPFADTCRVGKVEDEAYRDIDHRHRKVKDKPEIPPKFDSKSRLAT